MQFSEKQKEYIRRADKRWNIKCGAVRSGKSFVDTAFIIPYRIRKVADQPGINAIFGVSAQTIERNVLEPMREVYGKELVGTIRGSIGTVHLFGTEAYCIGCEKVNAVNRIRGLSLKYAYGDEIAGWNPEVFAMIESRLDKTYSVFDGACNPEGPNHWFKKWFDNPKIDAYVQKYILFDNPFLPKSFVESLCNEYEGSVYYDRYILGEWALAEGLIYPHYLDVLVDAEDIPQIEQYSLSIDYGTENAFAGILWGKGVDGVWYGLKEYYYSGRDTGIPKTDEEYADDMQDFVRDILEQYNREFEAAKAMDDPFAARRKLRTIVDPSAASFIACLQKRKGFKVQKADNNVADGIRDTAVAMKAGLIKINRSMKNWIDEVQAYRWDEKAGEDRPIKEKDHLMDSTRYQIFTLRIVQKARKRGM